MIPPEPDPPEPPSPSVFTYETATQFSLDGNFSAVFYSNLQYNGSDAKLVYLTNGSVPTDAKNLIVYTDALGDERFYLAYGSVSDFYGFLDDNVEVGLTCNLYRYVSGNYTSVFSRYVQSQAPDNLLSILRSGDYLLQQRS